MLIDAHDIKEQLGHGLDLVLDGGYKPNEPSSVIDLSGAEPHGAPRREGRRLGPAVLMAPMTRVTAIVPSRAA